MDKSTVPVQEFNGKTQIANHVLEGYEMIVLTYSVVEAVIMLWEQWYY